MDTLINVLITGANGQLGQEIQRNANILPEEQYRLFFADSQMVNITDFKSVNEFVKKNEIKYIINCAAYTAVDKAEDEDQIELCYGVNFEGIQNIGDAAKANNAKVIHVSTDYVFDGTKAEPYTESDSINPQSVYGKSKAKGESALFDASGLENSIVIRTSWLYSIYGNNFVKTMLRLGAERDSLNVVADQKGTPTNAKDLAIAILSIVKYAEEKEFKAGIYHYSNEGETTWYNFTLAIHKAANISCQVSPINTDQYPTKAKRPQYSVLDKTKIKSAFDLPIPQWEDSLNICIAELKQMQ